MREFFYNLATDERKGFIAGIIKFFLLVLSLIYGLAVSMLILFYRFRPCRLNCKVIGIGNITLGGTGKTSLVEYIARYLKQQGHKVVVISRGYKRVTRHKAQGTSAKDMGDEPFMLSRKLGDIPVIVDADRIRAIDEAIKDYSCDTVILDDAFQQWGIIKDLEIVTIDATNPFGNRYLIPRGILREPRTSLKRADIFMLTKTNLAESIQELKNYLTKVNPAAAIFESVHKPVGFYASGKPDELLNPQALEGKPAAIFSGIGDPDSFGNLLFNLGVKICLNFEFPDHHCYRQDELDRIFKNAKEKGISTVITTEKDAVRISDLRLPTGDGQLFVLCIAIEIEDEQRFHNRLRSLYPL